MKDERNHYVAVDKSFSAEQRIRTVDTNYILCEKIGPVQVAEPGFRQTKYRLIWKLLKITVYRKIRLLASFNQGTASLQQ